LMGSTYGALLIFFMLLQTGSPDGAYLHSST